MDKQAQSTTALDTAAILASAGVTWNNTWTSESLIIKRFLNDRINRAKRLQSETVTVTPEMAAYILTFHNARNRKVRRAVVASHQKKIEQGRMKLHSAGIAFAKDGNINNGQHRLLAVVAAGMQCDFYITFGEDVSAFDVHDVGARRNAADALHINGTKNPNVVSVAARLLILFERGELDRRSFFSSVDNDEVVDFVNDNPTLADCVRQGDRIRSRITGPSGAYGAALFLIEQHSKKPEKILDFVEHLVSGTNLSQSSPILKLRDAIQSGKLASEYHNNTDKNANIIATIINAWNLWSGNKSGSIRWQKSKPFPEIR